jgi:sugar lactone lactonase YvrE
LGWDPTGTIFYNVDTLIGCIWQRPYGPTKVDIGIPKLLIKFDNEYPDGMCVDSQGFLWVAIWGKGQVRRFSAMGELISTINIPAPHVSSVAFVGQELNLLLVTTATKDLSEKQLADFPDSGKLFICEPGVKGLLGTTWRR